MGDMEQRKEQIYQILIDKRMTVSKLSNIIDIHPKTLVNTLRTLANKNNLISERVYDNTISRFIVEYTANKALPYKAVYKKTKAERLVEIRLVKLEEKLRQQNFPQNTSNVRVVKLLDNPLPSAPKRKSGTAYKGIGSSFSMYDYY